MRKINEHKELKEKLINNSIWNLIALVVNKIGGLVFAIFLARMLLPEGYGHYSIILSLVMLFLVFFDPGINYSLARYLPYSLKYEKKKTSAYYTYFLKLKLVFSIFVAIILASLAYPLANFIYKDPKLFNLIFLGSIYIVALSLENFYTFAIYSVDKTKYVGIKEVTGQSIKVLMILLISIISVSNRVQYLILGLIMTSLILTIYCRNYFYKILPELKSNKHKKINKKKINKFVKFIMVTSIGGAIFSYADSLILGAYVPPAYVGFYRAALTLILGLTGLATFPNMVLLTSFTKINEKKIEALFNKAFRYIIIFAVPATLGLIALAKFFVLIFYGSAYINSVIPLYVLSIIILPATGIGILFLLFLAKERSELFARASVIVSLTSIFLNVLVIRILSYYSPEKAVLGASIATLISWAVYFTAAIFFVEKKLQIKVSFRALPKSVFSGVVMFVLLIEAIKLFGKISIFSVIVLVILGIVSYFVTMLIVRGIDRKDINQFYLIKDLVSARITGKTK